MLNPRPTHIRAEWLLAGMFTYRIVYENGAESPELTAGQAVDILCQAGVTDPIGKLKQAQGAGP